MARHPAEAISWLEVRNPDGRTPLRRVCKMPPKFGITHVSFLFHSSRLQGIAFSAMHEKDSTSLTVHGLLYYSLAFAVHFSIAALGSGPELGVKELRRVPVLCLTSEGLACSGSRFLLNVLPPPLLLSFLFLLLFMS